MHKPSLVRVSNADATTLAFVTPVNPTQKKLLHHRQIPATEAAFSIHQKGAFSGSVHFLPAFSFFNHTISGAK